MMRMHEAGKINFDCPRIQDLVAMLQRILELQCVERGEVGETRAANPISIQINKTPVSGLGGVGVSFSEPIATSPSNTAQFDTESAAL